MYSRLPPHAPSQPREGSSPSPAKARGGRAKPDWGLGTPLYKDSLRIAAELDATGNIVSRFHYAGAAHSPDTMVRVGQTYRIIKDQLGSPRLVVNIADGSVAQRLEYDAFGVVTLDTNPGFQPFGFAGGLYDADTGLVRFGARDYDAQVGRWTAKDPIRWDGGQANLYIYVGNNPVGFVDVSGLQANAPDWLIDLADSSAFQATGDFASGFSNAITFGLSNRLIDAVGLSDQQNRSSAAYSYGEVASYALALGRLSYAALAKGGSLLAGGDLARAVAFRNGLKSTFRLGLSRRGMMTVEQVLRRQGTVQAGIAAAGRTRAWLNYYAAAVLAGAAGAGSDCPE